ncbi:hypothetical protein HKD37_19G053714 [Glycine soja]
MVKFPTSNVQSFEFGMIGPLNESISCFLIRVDPWVHALAFRGLDVLNFRGNFLLSVPGPPPDIGRRPTVRAQPEREAITKLLCIPGQDFTRAAAKRRVRVMRTNMTTLTQIWMTLLLSNIPPDDRNADLPLRKYQLVWITPTRHPVDPKKSNMALGFLALVTDLCQSYRVPVPPARSCHRDIGKDRAHKTPSGPEEVQQGPRVSSSGYGPLLVLQGARPPSKVMDRAHKTPSGPEEVQQGPRVSSSDYGPLSVLRSVNRPQQGIAPTRHPVDPKKSNSALGFPALVTGLCQSYRVPVPPARSCHRDIGKDRTHMTPSGPEEVQQGPGVSSSGYGPLSVLQGARPPARSCHRDIGIVPVRHLVDPKKSNRVLELPALITGLCQFCGVSVTPSKVIRPPTNRAFIKKYCAPRQAQGETPQQPGDGQQRAADAPPPPLEFTSAHPQ